MMKIKDIGFALLAVSLFFGLNSIVHAATAYEVALKEDVLVLEDIEVKGVNLKPTIANIVMDIKSKVRYPMIARDRLLQGVATVQFMVSKSGGVRDVNLVTSSGHGPLDRAAIAAIGKIDTNVILDNAANEELLLTVPVAFILKKS